MLSMPGSDDEVAANDQPVAANDHPVAGIKRLKDFLLKEMLVPTGNCLNRNGLIILLLWE